MKEPTSPVAEIPGELALEQCQCGHRRLLHHYERCDGDATLRFCQCEKFTSVAGNLPLTSAEIRHALFGVRTHERNADGSPCWCPSEDEPFVHTADCDEARRVFGLLEWRKA